MLNRHAALFKKLPNCFSRWWSHFTFISAVYEASFCFYVFTNASYCLFYHSHYSKCEVVSHWVFNLHFSNKWWWGASFCVLIGHSYISFSKYLSKKFDHFYFLFFVFLSSLKGSCIICNQIWVASSLHGSWFPRAFQEVESKSFQSLYNLGLSPRVSLLPRSLGQRYLKASPDRRGGEISASSCCEE